jgi:hypothetical protein
MASPTPLYLVGSPRPRVGKTLVARLLIEFFHADGRPVQAFDLNPDDPALAEYLPACTRLADVRDTQGQMRLFDRLIVEDETPKVVDIGPDLFQSFFAVMDEIGFVREARRRGIEPVVLFVIDPDRLSTRTYAGLQQRFHDLAVVPVNNEYVTKGYPHREAFPARGAAASVQLRIPVVPAFLKPVVDRRSFSFVGFLDAPSDGATEMHGWINQIFFEFRELELRLLLDRLRFSLQR